MKRRAFLALPGAVVQAQSSDPEQKRAFNARWLKFANAMNDFIVGLRGGKYRADRLREGVQEWHRLEAEQGWEKLR